MDPIASEHSIVKTCTSCKPEGNKQLINVHGLRVCVKRLEQVLNLIAQR